MALKDKNWLPVYSLKSSNLRTILLDVFYHVILQPVLAEDLEKKQQQHIFYDLLSKRVN